MKIFAKLFIILSLSGAYLLADFTMSAKDIAVFNEKFKNVLLVINFNHPHYGNIPFLKELYSRFFSKIIFYGEQAHPEVTALKINRGFLLGPVIYDVLTTYPDYKGYIFLQDDCVLNVWNCLDLDLDKFWLPFATLHPTANSEYVWYQWADMVDPQGNWGALNPAHWTAPRGFTAVIAGWEKLLPRDRENLAKNVGINKIPGAQCDLFYIPQRFKDETIRLNAYFMDAFCEYAVPAMISCMDLKSNWERTTLFWNYGLGQQWPMEATTVHPVKLSNHSVVARTREAFNKVING